MKHLGHRDILVEDEARRMLGELDRLGLTGVFIRREVPVRPVIEGTAAIGYEYALYVSFKGAAVTSFKVVGLTKDAGEPLKKLAPLFDKFIQDMEVIK